jgi:predicted amidophosphoribosyltransferase
MSNFRPAQPLTTQGWTNLDWANWLTDTGIIKTVRSSDAPVCQRCRRPVGTRYDGSPWPHCYACNEFYSGLATTIVPISYSGSGRLTSLIAQAKEEPERAWIRMGLASVLFNFMQAHQSCLQEAVGGAFDIATVIPSHPSKRDGRDHMKDLISTFLTWPGYPFDLDLLEKQTVAAAARRRNAVDSSVFRVCRPDVSGLRVLLIDDLYTSGSTTAAACAALQDAGARPPLVLTIGRQLDLNDQQAAQFAVDQDINERSFEPDDCAVHVTDTRVPSWFD